MHRHGKMEEQCGARKPGQQGVYSGQQVPSLEKKDKTLKIKLLYLDS